MAKSSPLMAASRAVSDGDARRIVAECRRCFEEETERLGPSTRMRMLAIQRAMEATPDLPKGFGLKAINDQIRQIAKGEESVPPAVASGTTSRAERQSSASPEFLHELHQRKNGRRERRRFNSYVRDACKRLGLQYIAVIGGSPSGKYEYYYLKHARDEAELREPAMSVERLTAILAKIAARCSPGEAGAPTTSARPTGGPRRQVTGSRRRNILPRPNSVRDRDRTLEP